MNNDGFVEMARVKNYGLGFGFFATIIEVFAIGNKAKPMLAVMYNWTGRTGWGWSLSDRDGDGIHEIDFGPSVKDGVNAKVTFRWDKAKGAYVGPKADEEDHYRQIDPSRVSAELKRLRAQGLRVPWLSSVTFSSPSTADTTREEPTIEINHRTPPPAKPYRNVSLKNQTNSQILLYMGKGKAAWEFKRDQAARTQTPKGFWIMPPREAAMEIAKVHRSSSHRDTYLLAIDDRDGQRPPQVSSVAFSYTRRGCFVYPVDCHYFLRADPGGSYLAYARGSDNQFPFGFGLAPSRYDYRFCELPYVQARQVTETLWWLHRLRTWHTRETDSVSFSGSWGDGDGTFRLLSESGDTMIQISGRSWSDAFPKRHKTLPGVYPAVRDRWSGHYDEETFLNLAQYLITRVLPQQLGNDWSRFDVKHPSTLNRYRLSGETPKMKYEKSEVDPYRAAARRVLDVLSQDQRHMSLLIAQQAALAVGHFGFADLAPLLEQINHKLPAPDQPVRQLADVRRDKQTQRKLRAKRTPKRDWRALILSGEPPSFSKLYDEEKALRHGLQKPAAREGLRSAIDRALNMLVIADDAAELKKWASSDREGWRWALDRLKHIDRDRYVASLEWRLQKTDDDMTHRRILRTIHQVSPAKAKTLKESVPEPPNKFDEVIDKADAIVDLKKRIDALIAVAMDPGNDWHQRGDALDRLVPSDDPLKYDAQRIDQALVKLMDPKLRDETINFTLANAAKKSALRKRLEHFDRIKQAFNDTDNRLVRDKLLGALTYLADKGDSNHRKALHEILRDSLQHYNMEVSEVIWCVWALGMKELKLDIERIATAGPEDYEGEFATSAQGSPRKITGRYHLARKIAAIWNEKDQATRGKLLLPYYFSSYHMDADIGSLGADRFKVELRALAQSMTTEQTREVASFIKWYEHEHHARGYWSMNMARRAFGMPELKRPKRKNSAPKS